ncbi:hypothetical protein HN807_06805 [Candidatus Bathyarchaeota archaeon]|jgi:uncharacterized membrane protein YozB (DUF420 family)|nr:hypothetical protein [Candidatus Bathyarchaeota archaeon]MBT4321478.1 hypothetical protein [Candidatus Bathyarchaeota archaeon]MBT4424238.1 hypothetical protein [Candidatus Bathyarchaeota archaeon]MBT5641927.1 hypothetical protein [Candidatus Bathyarchaeota archaeon]MBT6603820.1 hypothetical protein [Candidatus Bathyarchaeota archaeon]
MGFLGTSAPLQSDLSLIAQGIILVVLFYGVTMVKKKEYMKHAYMMLGSLILTLWNAFIVMVPKARSLVRMYRPYGLSLLVRIHMTFGVIVLLLGFYLIWVWRLDEPGPCFKQSGKMRKLAGLWMLEVLGGFVIYYLLYV